MSKREINKKIVKYNILSNTLGYTITIGIITVLFIIFKEKLIPYNNIIKPIYLLLFIFALFESFIEPFIDIKTYKYEICDKKIQYTQGIFFIKTVMLPINRIQHVTMTKNPLLNKLDLVKIEIATTTGSHYLRNISVDEGVYIVDKITDMLFCNVKEEESNHEL
ncbi:PH domain-containing protein [Romboutsia sedimentorum]|uniref:PH domain-containing protein n=1 Tax=Romboutsia sedimentorum TaxID=1368474 RepID=A0ABT7E5E8_9FIRM|nr:PH domain-containing protein [Romboutsia sedimentorum]MDK2562154.1 PH domain-containing protein [Romboutsia sedimentorum]